MVKIMIFDEIYSVYYNTLNKLLALAIEEELDEHTFRQVINDNAYDESISLIEKEISNEKWNILTKDFYTPINNSPKSEITTLQRRFLKTISNDPRFKLFSDIEYNDIEPLYNINDIIYFDKFNSSDDFTNPDYINNFRTIIKTIKAKGSCYITFTTGKGIKRRVFLIPQKIEYSKKDDKFRILSNKYTINFSSIINIEIAEKKRTRRHYIKKETIEVIIYDQRYALERSMIAFSGFEKETEKIDDKVYKMKLTYHKEDQTELLIRILSFGPMLKVVSPSSFVNLIIERLEMQKKLQQ